MKQNNMKQLKKHILNKQSTLGTVKKNLSLAEVYRCRDLKHINVTIIRSVLLTEPHGTGFGKDMR